ncbi:hypothetical protein PPTG_10812 [Phytophthora nicotianae INRA-310]|uniref:Uncharacterized protein n=1 Tax=Phytophthora nicotianae (strain INRA-310) TaxID=761204 RepID=W2QCS1_PHYN3|nr:hypothetical protein PPTG_10812 [Phytophthora nicotianae INRA-310]ETN10080.1 hypothetical protein PPTG_10812 [Phytophthora nicotianae INRA-310]
MTGEASGVTSRLQNVCAPCLHQFDLVMQSVYSSAMDDKFINIDGAEWSLAASEDLGRDKVLSELHELPRDLVHSYCAMSGMVGPLTKKGIDTKITQQPTEICGNYALSVKVRF